MATNAPATAAPPSKQAVAAASDAADAKKKKAKKERIYVHVEWLEKTLTVLFFVELVYIFVRFPSTDDRVFLVASLAGTAVAIYVVKRFAGWLGKGINMLLPWKPLSKQVNHSKFVEQFWQFVVHTSLAYADWAVMDGEDWWDNDVSWWSPAPWKQVHKRSLKFVIMLQLVRAPPARRFVLGVMHDHGTDRTACDTATRAHGTRAFGYTPSLSIGGLTCPGGRTTTSCLSTTSSPSRSSVCRRMCLEWPSPARGSRN